MGTGLVLCLKNLDRDDGVQMFFKEHGRTGSKGSQSSFLSRKKSSQAQKRPETKIRSEPQIQMG
jgi:serine/arginine repetitive matrix protein 2